MNKSYVPSDAVSPSFVQHLMNFGWIFPWQSAQSHPRREGTSSSLVIPAIMQFSYQKKALLFLMAVHMRTSSCTADRGSTMQMAELPVPRGSCLQLLSGNQKLSLSCSQGSCEDNTVLQIKLK